jgi:hypothetical protein
MVNLLQAQPQNGPAFLNKTSLLNGQLSTRALRINQSRMIGNENHEVDILSKTFITDGSDVTFDLALVLDYWGPGHEDHNAYFRAAVTSLDGQIVYDEICIEAANFMPSFNTLNYDGSVSTDVFLKFRNWGNETLTTGPAGQPVRLIFEAGDCAHIAHAGYAYVDNIIIGTQPDPVTPVISCLQFN